MKQAESEAAGSELPSAARVVVIGGGVIGCSVAYHLAKRGWSDVVVCERDRIGCGTTWHAHGLVGLLRATPNLTRLALRTNQVLKELEAETGLATGFKQNGSLIVTADRDHLEQLARMSSSVRRLGLDLERISIDEAAQLWPLVQTKDLVGAFFMPAEGQTNPMETVTAYAKAARNRGVRIFEQTTVIAVNRKRGRAVGVSTDSGDVEAEYVVNCAGIWGWEVGRLCDVSVPVVALEQSYVVTEPIAELSANMPMLRDFQAGIGVREDARQLTIGIPSPQVRPWATEGIPDGFSFDELPADWAQFEPTFNRMLHRIPALEHAGIRKLLSAPDPYAPDSLLFLGEVPELGNYYVASGMSGVGIGSSGGIGQELAAWVIDGRPSMDLWEVDVRRFMAFEASRRYQVGRLGAGGSALFDVFWPYYQPAAARGIRRSPLHDRLYSAGAHFDKRAGWEIPAWFVPDGRDPGSVKSYQRQPWFELSRDEHLCSVNNIGLSDLSHDAKLLVQGRNAISALKKVFANDIEVKPGWVVHTPVLNGHGGIEAYVEVHRLDEERIIVMAESSLQTKVRRCLERNAGAYARPAITDITSDFALIGLMGARVSDLLKNLDVCPATDDEFPKKHFRELNIGYASARVTRYDYGDIPAWEICVPVEFARGLYDTLIEVARGLGICHVGSHARRGLLMESGVRHRGEIYSSLDTPLEVGLEHLLAWGKRAGYVGEAALRRQREKGVTKQLARFALHDASPLLFGNEPIVRNAVAVGHVSRAGYGHRLGAAVALGYIESTVPLTTEFISNARYQIEIGGNLCDARLLSATSGWTAFFSSRNP